MVVVGLGRFPPLVKQDMRESRQTLHRERRKKSLKAKLHLHDYVCQLIEIDPEIGG